MPPRWAWCLPCFLLVVGVARAADSRPQPYDWPQWLGPQRNGASLETGLLKTWPLQGPALLWKAAGLGGGYSTPSVAAGRIFGLGWRNEEEVVWALDEATHQPLWSKVIASAKVAAGSEAREGSRSTPTVDGNRLYALGQNGDLVCLEVSSGDVRWHKNLVTDFGGGIPRWGYSESPLVDGDRLICTPGGAKATLVALNKDTGATIWKAQVSQGNGAEYASVIAADLYGHREYIQLLKGAVVGVAATDGHFLWQYDKPANRIANCSTPIFHDNAVFAASGYGTGGGLARLVQQGTGVKAEEVYFTKQMKNQHGGMVLVDGYLYGANDPGSLVCLEFKTGKVMWEERSPGKGSITYADGRLYYRNEGGKGRLFLIEANPSKYVVHGSFDQPDRSGKSAWPHPVVANGKLYIRDQDLLLCFDVKEH
jgi:outer membrane protein assembly factor BamB